MNVHSNITMNKLNSEKKTHFHSNIIMNVHKKIMNVHSNITMNELNSEKKDTLS